MRLFQLVQVGEQTNSALAKALEEARKATDAARAEVPTRGPVERERAVETYTMEITLQLRLRFGSSGTSTHCTVCFHSAGI